MYATNRMETNNALCNVINFNSVRSVNIHVLLIGCADPVKKDLSFSGSAASAIELRLTRD